MVLTKPWTSPEKRRRNYVYPCFQAICSHRPAIHKLFDAIQQDHVSPEERARMIDEYHQEELQQTQFEEGKRLRQQEIAASLLKEGIAWDIIVKTTGSSQKELEELEEGTRDKGQ